MGGHRCMAVKAMVIDSPVVLQLYAYIYIYIPICCCTEILLVFRIPWLELYGHSHKSRLPQDPIFPYIIQGKCTQESTQHSEPLIEHSTNPDPQRSCGK